MRSATSRFPLLDGIRAVSILWLVVFHCLWFAGFFMAPTQFMETLRAGGLASYLILHGHLGVDLFFALSGFLITNVLLAGPPAGEGRLTSFYRRRAFRILPVYGVVAIIYALAGGTHLGNLWANALFVNNYLPVARQAMGWTWSLAIEEQFYLFFPLIFLATRRPKQSVRGVLATVIGLTLLALAIRGYVIFTGSPWEEMPLHPKVDGERFYSYFDTLYGRTHMRVSGLFFGILARLLLEEGTVRAWLQSHRRVAHLLFGLALAGLASVVLLKLVLNATNLEAAFRSWALFIDRPLFAASASYLMLYGLAVPDSGSRLIRFLSHRAWKPWAEISYSAFLLNPIVFTLFGFIFGASLKQGSLTTYAGLSILTTFALATVLFHAVETPFRRLGARAQPSTGSLPADTVPTQN